MNGNTNKLTNVLQQVRFLKDKYKELATVTGEHFNVFSILGVETDEVSTHSAFLADLLNPKGSHRQGSVFLRLFLDECICPQPDTYNNIASFRVTTGQIDILLKKKDACIVIENKIYAKDQIRQIERYYQEVRKEFTEEQIKLVYLTLDGSSPSEQSRGDLPEDRVKCLSYSKDIINWLEECMKLKEVQRISPIREIVFQYRDLLKQLTGQSTNRRDSMELTKLLIKDKNYELIPDLEKMILEFKVHLQYEFWEELKKQILELPEVDWHENEKQSQIPSEENIRHLYLGSKSRYVHQTYRLTFVGGQQYDIALRIGTEYASRLESDSVYFGFVLFKNGRQVDYCQDEQFSELAEKMGSGFNRNANLWLVWKNLGQDIGFYVAHRSRVPECMPRLLEDNERRKEIEKFVAEIAAAVTQLKENLN